MATNLRLVLLWLGTLASICYGNMQFGQASTPQQMKHISGGPGYIWGIGYNDDIYRCDNPCTSWTQINGKLMQIDVGDNVVWGVNSGHAIFKRPVDGSGKWTRVAGALKHVSASGNGYIWGVNKYDHIFKCKKPCSGSWIKVDGALKQIDGGHKYVYGVNKNDQIWTRPVDGSGKWRSIPGSLKHISASGSDDIFGVNKLGNIYRCPKPCVGQWEQMEGGLEQCDATFNSLVGVAGSGSVWFHPIGS